jgi:hypothetical protein
MSTDFSIRPVGAPVPPPVVRPQPDAAVNAVRTELPAPLTTTAPDNSGAASNNPQPSADQFSHDIIIDRAAAEIVYRVIDERTSEVISQYPDEVRLRARAYFRSLDEAKLNRPPVRLDQHA